MSLTHCLLKQVHLQQVIANNGETKSNTDSGKTHSNTECRSCNQNEYELLLHSNSMLLS